MIKKAIQFAKNTVSLLGDVADQSSRLSAINRSKALFSALMLQATYALKKKYFFKNIHGYKMRLDIHRPGIGYELAIWGGREELDTYVVRQQILPGMHVVDVGANIGYYTLLLSSCVGNKGKIFAYEPFPENFSDLQHNVVSNELKDLVTTNQKAVSNTSGQATFFVGKADNLGTMMDYTAFTNEAQKSISVETTTIDEIVAEVGPIDFLRMDIEGSEVQVFEGMKNTFKQAIPPRVLFEIHPVGPIDPDPRFTPTIEKLLEVGYLPKYAISSSNEDALQAFAVLGYRPIRFSKEGQGLFEDIRPEDFIKIAARRPKITRSLYLIHSSDKRGQAH